MSFQNLSLGSTLIIIGLITQSFCVQAEKPLYTKPPFAAFTSQMPDALLGNSKYQKPVWNLHDYLQLPNWLELNIEQRTRYETLSGSYRKGTNGGDQQIPLQTSLWLAAHLNHFRIAGEFLDARQWGSDSGSGVNNTQVNSADLIQAYLAWSTQNLAYSGYGAEFMIGRQTLNLGSRRLVARNYFRNTINSFEAIKFRLTDYENWQLQAFVSLPVNRYPSASNDILQGGQSFDTADGHTWFSGFFLEGFNLMGKLNSELYLYHLDESDSEKVATRNRRYFTPGLRLFIKPIKGNFDFQSETIGQFGSVRATNLNTDNLNLTHKAWYQHLDIGYTFDIVWSPRLAFEYDYASGDHNPNDNIDQRFDSLYGARRFDFNPTGIYGAFSRSNINSPGYRINFSPNSTIQAQIDHRFFWLAAAKDMWTTANLQDKTGNTKDFIGHQLDISLRWDMNSSLNLETGWAHLFKGAFAKYVPNAPEAGDLNYFYAQSILRF